MLSYKSLKVLIIDDEAFSRRVVRAALTQLGIDKIIEADDGASGLIAYSANFPDVVICDYEMAPVDGLVFLRALQSERKYFKTLAPVIFLSSHHDADRVREVSKHGGAAFLVKPATAADIKRRLDHVLADRMAANCA